MEKPRKGALIWAEGIGPPLPDHRLQVDFVSGARLLPNDPAVWNSAVTDGIFVRIGHVEISHDELLDMAEREHGIQEEMEELK